MIHALWGLVRHEFLMARSYWLNGVSAMLFGYVTFVLLFFGVRSFGGPSIDLGRTTESLIVAYLVIALTNMSFQSVGGFVSDQTMTGTLEQLYLSPYPFWWIALGKMLGSTLFNLLFNMLFLFVMMVTTGRWLRFDAVSTLPLILALVSQAFGLGLSMGGLALIYKRISVLAQVVTVLLVVCIAAPSDMSPLVRFLPFNLGWQLLRTVMADGVRIWEITSGDLAFIAAQTLVYFGLGWAVYNQCEQVAKRQALLGRY